VSLDVDQLELCLLDKKVHDRGGFSCGEPSLDDYLQKQAAQDATRNAAVVYVLVDPRQPSTILGYFTLSSAGVRLDSLPQDARKGLAPYPEVPALLIGRLAVSTAHQGSGLGGELLGRALEECGRVAQRAASSFVIVDALNEQAARFYRRYGFGNLDSAGERLYITMRTLRQAGS